MATKIRFDNDDLKKFMSTEINKNRCIWDR